MSYVCDESVDIKVLHKQFSKKCVQNSLFLRVQNHFYIKI